VRARVGANAKEENRRAKRGRTLDLAKPKEVYRVYWGERRGMRQGKVGPGDAETGLLWQSTNYMKSIIGWRQDQTWSLNQLCGRSGLGCRLGEMIIPKKADKCLRGESMGLSPWPKTIFLVAESCC